MASTKEQILDTAQRICQRDGHHGFSFRDLARELGIKSASVHHHFSTKEDLLRALLARYSEAFSQRLAEIQVQAVGPSQMLEFFVGEFEQFLAMDGRVCMCGMLAAESESLSDELRSDLRLFFERGCIWLAEILERGRQEGVFKFQGASRDASLALIAALQGILITSRLMDGVKTYRSLSAWLTKSSISHCTNEQNS